MRQCKTYQARPIRFVELWNFNEWKIKINKISEKESDWHDQYLNIAKKIAQKELMSANDSHKFGFMTIHIAKMFNQIIIDWWAQENELRHLVFKANAKTPELFENITASGEAFCIWELSVICHERSAWIENVLKHSEHPNFKGYLDQIVNIME